MKVFGPGVEPGVKAKVPTHFNIDCQEAGPGDVKVKLSDEKGKELPTKLSNHGDGTYTVDYVAPAPGEHKVNVSFAGKDIPQCPIKVSVKPQADTSKIKVNGLEPTVFLDSPTEFIVDARAINKKSEATVKCQVQNPSGSKTDCLVQPQNDGTYKVMYTPFEEGIEKENHFVLMHFEF